VDISTEFILSVAEGINDQSALAVAITGNLSGTLKDAIKQCHKTSLDNQKLSRLV
jgi:hypothetical protein